MTQAPDYMVSHKKIDPGSYQPVEDRYGGVAVNCINPIEQPGTKEYYIVPNVDTSLLKANL